MSGTSNISLRQFVHVAKQGDGDVQLSRDQSQLVNKGSWNHKIATVFHDIGEALGLIGDDNRRGRQNEALTGFRTSLVDMYGLDIAKEALRDSGLDLHDEGKLTGAKILEVVDRAKGLRDGQIEKGRDMIGNMILERKDDYDQLFTGARQQLEKSGKQLSETDEKQFMQRLQDRCLRESDLYSNELTSLRVLHFAEDEMAILLDELQDPDMSSRRWWEEDIAKFSRQLLEGGLTRDQTQHAFDKINNAMAKLQGLGVSGLSSEEDYRQSSLAFFARELSSLMKKEDGTIDESKLKELGKVQRELVRPGSVLSQNYREPKDYNYRDGFKTVNIDHSSTQGVVKGMVEAMARIMGPLTDSLNNDLVRVTGQPGLLDSEESV